MTPADIAALRKDIKTWAGNERKALTASSERIQAIAAGRSGGGGISLSLGDLVDLAKKEVDTYTKGK